MMEMSVTLDTSAFDAVLAALAKPELDKPVALALVDTQKNTKVKAASTIARHMGATSAGVKEAIVLPYVKVGAYQADVLASKKPIPLIDFAPTQNAVGVSTRAWGKSQTIRSAFIATMPTGHRGVYRRVNTHRLPVKELWGPTVLGTFITQEVADKIRATMRERIAKNIARRVAAAIRRANRRRAG